MSQKLKPAQKAYLPDQQVSHLPRILFDVRVAPERWQLLSEHKEIKLSRGVRTTVWKRIRDRNEALDLAVMILCLLDVFRSRIDQMSGPQLVQDAGEKPPTQQEPGRSTWGAQPVNVADPYILALQAEQRAQRGQQQPNGRSFGVQNRPLQW